MIPHFWPGALLALVVLLPKGALCARVVSKQWLTSAPALYDDSGCAPQQVHLSLGKDVTEMYISWKTAGERDDHTIEDEASTPPAAAANAVGYSFILSMGSHAATEGFWSEQHHLGQCPGSARMGVAIGSRVVGNTPGASLIGLEPGARYKYQIDGGGCTGGASACAAAPGRFRAAPRPSPDTAVAFAAFGDLGESHHRRAKSPGAAATMAALARDADARNIDMVLHVGDIAYANGDPEIWDTFMDSIEPLASHLPWMVAAGNHEVDYTGGSASDPSGEGPYHPNWGNYGEDSGGECGAMLARRFHMPHARLTPDAAAAAAAAAVRAGLKEAKPMSESPGVLAEGGAGAKLGADSSTGSGLGIAAVEGDEVGSHVYNNAPFWYGFDYGSVHFTVISTEHDVAPGSRQYRWLEEELASVDRCTTPWLVLLLHRPMYVVYPHKSNREVGDHLRASLEGLLTRYRVDAAISGHVHSYYRTCPVVGEVCVADPAGEDYGTRSTMMTSADNDDNADDFSGSNNSGGGGGGQGQWLLAGNTSYNGGAGAGSGASGAGAVSGRGGGTGRVGSSEHGVVHLVVGSAGHKLSDIDHGQEDWCAAKEHTWGYARLTVNSATSMLVEFVESETQEVLDRYEIVASAARREMCRRTASL